MSLPRSVLLLRENLMFTPHSSFGFRFPHDPDIYDEELKRFHVGEVAERQVLEAIIRAIEEGRCPLQKLPAVLCRQCVDGHPDHFPKGLVTQLRSVLKRQADRSRNLLAGLGVG